MTPGPGDQRPGSESRESRTVRIMLERTRQLWEKQDQHSGDRQRLFSAVADSIDVTAVLYPGSYVDLAPSLVWPSVTYVDVDRRANSFFGDVGGIAELLVEYGADAGHEVQFIHADYQDPLDLDEEAFDLLISLYAGFVSEHCTHHLRRGGFLLLNPSHGDAAMASIDSRYELWAVVVSRGGRYSVRRDDLDSYLVPKRDVEVTKEFLHSSGRGVGYTRSPFAYIFRRID